MPEFRVNESVHGDWSAPGNWYWWGLVTALPTADGLHKGEVKVYFYDKKFTCWVEEKRLNRTQPRDHSRRRLNETLNFEIMMGRYPGGSNYREWID